MPCVVTHRLWERGHDDGQLQGGAVATLVARHGLTKVVTLRQEGPVVRWVVGHVSSRTTAGWSPSPAPTSAGGTAQHQPALALLPRPGPVVVPVVW